MKQELKDLAVYQNYAELYKKQILKIRERVAKGEKIRAGFFTVSLSTMGTRPIFEQLLKDELFECKIVIIPNSYSSYKVEGQHEKAIEMFGEDNVLQSYIKDGETFKLFNNRFDIIFFSNPYDYMVIEGHSIEHFARLGILTVFTQYGFLISNHHCERFIQGHEISCLWRYYIETKSTYEEYIAKSIMKEQNARFLGYAKMDGLKEIPPLPITRKRKRIIITAHHSMYYHRDSKGIRFGSFLRYYDFYLKLALLYPEIDFVFRPHGMFIMVLRQHWPQAFIDEYLNKIEAIPNMYYNTTPEYYDLFSMSDAMINDCGSFTAEYIFTGKPMCLLSKGPDIDEENYNAHFALKCVNNHYKAHNELEILSFIEEVVIKGNDYMKQERMKFFEEEVRGFWPHSTIKIVDDLKSAILG